MPLSHVLIFHMPKPALAKTMLWKYIENCMYSFRENWKINLTIWHTLPHFNLWLFTISVKSKVFFQCCSGIMWPCGMVSIYLVRKGKYDWSLHEGLLLDWIIFLLYLLQFVGCSKCSAKTTNFSALNLFLHFLQGFVLKPFRIFVVKSDLNFIAFLAENFIGFIFWHFACMV